MKTIGEILKEARKKKGFSFREVEAGTKIKKDFILAIENERWEKLPDYPVVLGFVKNIGDFLDVDPKKAAAFLRRDYPPKNLPVNPKPDVSKQFVWSPKLTFLVGIIVVFLAIGGYLGFQYYHFISPPEVSISVPKENQKITKNSLTVVGKTDSDATVEINNQPVIVDDNGDFTAELDISENTKEIVVKAVSRSGKETVVQRKIDVQLNK